MVCSACLAAKEKDKLDPRCERGTFNQEALSSEGGCYWADPSEDHELYILHALTNSAWVKDTGGVQAVMETWAEENGKAVSVGLFADLAEIHAEFTRMNGPQILINANMVTVKSHDGDEDHPESDEG